MNTSFLTETVTGGQSPELNIPQNNNTYNECLQIALLLSTIVQYYGNNSTDG